jgi:hypothetical protein
MSRYSRSKKMSRRAEAARRRSRRANSGLPGEDNLGWDHFGHPASSEQPSADAYGFDSEFGEGVRKGPYRSGPAPASVGWRPEHPAASDELTEDYALTDDLRQENLKKAMERKAAKCIQIAESRLGRTASQREIEDLALRMMDLPNRTVNARVARLADNAVSVGTGYDEGLSFTGPDNASDEIEASEEQGHGMFDEYDIDGDEMISMDEWGGSDSAFNSMDLNDDGFLSHDEISQGLGDSFADDVDDDDDIAAIMAELEGEDTDLADWGAMSSAEQLAEEIVTLKAANARLARKVRKLADNAVQVGTDYQGEDPDLEIETKAEEEPSEGEPTQRLAKIERLAEALSAYMGESNLEADDDMTSILAELDAEDTEASDTEADMNDSQYGYSAEDNGSDIMGLDMNADESIAMDPRLASIFTASDEEDSDEESDEDSAEESNEEESKEEKSKEESKKKASYRPRKSARKAAVKTLGNISREASSSSDELSKLWDSAPDVSKFFG